MNKLKFSADYEKLPKNWEGTQAVLAAVVECKINRIKKALPAFVKYDTAYRGNKGYYKLDFEKGLILFFIHLNSGRVFTTIRRHYPKKYKYYLSNVGKTFLLAKE